MNNGLIWILLLSLVAVSSPLTSSAQSFDQAMLEMRVRQEESRTQLRKATLELLSATRIGCAAGRETECHAAMLLEAESKAMDLEHLYARRAERAISTAATEHARAVQAALGDVRKKLDEARKLVENPSR